MSRVAKSPVELPSGVEFSISGRTASVKGKSGTLSIELHQDVAVEQNDNVLTFAPASDKASWAQVGTARALINNMVIGASEGFTKTLNINGVGYRAQAKGSELSLSLGFSHPVDYKLPEGVSAETPSNTVIVLKSCDKQLLGQVAAEIRAYRPPEPYKGKGIRYVDEQVRRKEAKKK